MKGLTFRQTTGKLYENNKNTEIPQKSDFGKWAWDKSSNTLTLTDFQFASYGGKYAWYGSSGGYTPALTLDGTNTITVKLVGQNYFQNASKAYGYAGPGLEISGSTVVNLTGSGTLDLVGSYYDNHPGLRLNGAGGQLVAKSGQLKVAGVRFEGSGSKLVVSGGTVKVTNYYDKWAPGSVLFNNGTLIQDFSKVGNYLISTFLEIKAPYYKWQVGPNSSAPLATNTNGSVLNMVLDKYVMVQSISAPLSVVYRVTHKDTKEHVWITSRAEYDDWAKNPKWDGDGAAWVAATSGTPVNRLYNPKNNSDRIYSSNAKEIADLKAIGWTDEKILFYSTDKTGIPVHRLYAGKCGAPKPGANGVIPRIMSKDTQEIQQHKDAGWCDEGILFYAKP